MKNHSKLGFITFFIFIGLYSFAQDLTVNFPESKQTFTIQNKKFSIKANWASPITQPAFADAAWRHVNRS